MAFDAYLSQHKGKFFAYHLVTVPDIERFPRPAPVERPREEVDLKALISGNADIINRKLKSGILKDDQLETLNEMEVAGKNRSTVLKHIYDAVKALGKNTDLNEWLRYGEDPWRCQIIAISWMFVDEGQPHVICTHGAVDESAILRMFWALQETGIRTGYGISTHEDRIILARSMALGVDPTVPFESGKYSRQVVDVMWKLFPGGKSEAWEVKSLARTLGIPVEVFDGDVLSWWEAQDWQSIWQSAANDVVMERDLFVRMRKYLV